MGTSSQNHKSEFCNNAFLSSFPLLQMTTQSVCFPVLSQTGH